MKLFLQKPFLRSIAGGEQTRQTCSGKVLILIQLRTQNRGGRVYIVYVKMNCWYSGKHKRFPGGEWVNHSQYWVGSGLACKLKPNGREGRYPSPPVGGHIRKVKHSPAIFFEGEGT